jgi:hypothetical protein
MLQITADVFSGRPNPTWIVADTEEIRAALRDVVKAPSLAAKQAAGLGQLGELRGFYLDIASDELAADHGVASALYLPLEAGGTGPMRDLAERLISLASTESVAMGALADLGSACP